MRILNDMKRTKFVVCMLMILAVFIGYVVFSPSDIVVKIQNNPVNFNRLHNGQPLGKPYIQNGRTFVPLRILSEDLGYKVTWIQEKQTAVVEKGKTKVEIKIGESTALVNGVRKNIDVSEDGVVRDTKALIKDGRTYVPVRFIAEAMGEKVEYRQPGSSNVTVRTVYINCTDLPEEKPVEKPQPNGLVPRFTLVPHTKAGSMDYEIFLNNFKEYQGTGAKFSSVLVSHPQYNSYKVKDPNNGEWHIVNDESKIYANMQPQYQLSTFNLVMWKRDGSTKGQLDINTGKPQQPPKVGEIMKWRIVIDMNSGQEVYEIDIPYRNFDSFYTNGTRIK